MINLKRFNLATARLNLNTPSIDRILRPAPIFIVLLIINLIFFWPVWLKQLLPMPTDSLMGMYHPFRDYFAVANPNGVTYKNPILTDPVLQQIPWKWLAIESWKSGEIPRENIYNFSTTPLLGNIQAGALYPLNLIFFLGNFPWMWTGFIILQPLLASLFMAWWLRQHRLHPLAVLFGSIVWAYSSFNLVWLEWGNIGHAGLWLPLVLLAVDKISSHPEQSEGSRRDSSTAKGGLRMTIFWHALLQFSLIASLLAGHWQITLYLLLSVFVYVLFFKRFNLAAARLNLNKISLFFAHCSLLIVLTAPQWLPAWRFMAASNRGVEQENVLLREGFFISPKHLIQLAVPDFFGNPATGNYRGEWNYAEQVIYVGIIPLALAILALLNIFTNQTRKDVVNSTSYSIKSLQRFGLILIAVGLIFAVKNPIAEIPYKLNIPILSDLQPTRLSYLITFGLSVLAAVGMEGLIRRSDSVRNDRNVMVIIGGLGIVFLTLLIYSSKLNVADKVVSQRNLILPMLIWGLLGVAGATAWIFARLPRLPTLRRGPRPPAIAWRRSNWRAGNDSVILFSIFYFLFSIFDLFRFGWKFTPFSPKEYLYPITPAIKFLQNNMRETDRYMTLDRRILPPNANIIYGLKSIEGYDPIYSKQYALLIDEMESGAVSDGSGSFGRIVRPTNYKSPITVLLGVRYVLSMTDIEDKDWIKVFQEGETRVYERR